ncbi:MAG TPA: DNA-directed RNA polymerase subunit L [Candidatus Diapherotrites archaeon]|uniref:DNA-directed RNA polymerase subunit Rpo11 n=1 Tax=Candidatus Iainarchaeum sp. TaxID=3101447 RepID=A0A7J4JKU6_9ARCH|nr:DNA-directed RNA polymerase subunit L [Candidatus Diapherotrites archaeon]HIH16537.1 DNA-directed RNA polymerase subunit L [Candidatus Diapherotrites archaeon]
MQLELVKNEPNHVEFILKDERHTFPALLQSRLLNNEAVTFASYALGHPMDKDTKFVLKTKGVSAKKALSEACDAIEDELKEFGNAVKKALK